MTHPGIHNIPRPGTSHLSTAPRLNMQQKMKHRHSWPHNVSQYKKSLNPFCTMHGRWSLSPLLAQRPVQSNEICIITGGQRRTYNHVARPNERHYPQTFETHVDHDHGPYESETPKHKVHLENADFGRATGWYRLGHKNPPCVCRPGRSRTTLHGLNRKIPGEIQQRKLICHGLICS
jgi:hypothetical protein